MSPDIGNAEVKLYPSIHTWEKNADSSPTTGTVFPQVNHHFTLRIERKKLPSSMVLSISFWVQQLPEKHRFSWPC